MKKTMKERVQAALEDMPDDLPLNDFLDRLHKLIQVRASPEDIALGNVISNDELWKTQPWRR